MRQNLIDHGIGQGQEIAVAGRIAPNRKAHDIGIAVGQASFGLIADLRAKRDLLDPGNPVGQVNEDVWLAAGAAQLEIEVIGAAFGAAIAPKAEEPVAGDEAQRGNGRFAGEVIGAAGKNEPPQGNWQRIGIEQLNPILVRSCRIGSHPLVESQSDLRTDLLHLVGKRRSGNCQLEAADSVGNSPDGEIGQLQAESDLVQVRSDGITQIEGAAATLGEIKSGVESRRVGITVAPDNQELPRIKEDVYRRKAKGDARAGIGHEEAHATQVHGATGIIVKLQPVWKFPAVFHAATVAGGELVNDLSARTESQKEQKTESNCAYGQKKSPAWNL